MTVGETASPGTAAAAQLATALVVAAIAALGLLGCRVALRFEQPEAGTDAPMADRACTTNQQCANPLPHCDRSTGRAWVA